MTVNVSSVKLNPNALFNLQSIRVVLRMTKMCTYHASTCWLPASVLISRLWRDSAVLPDTLKWPHTILRRQPVRTYFQKIYYIRWVKLSLSGDYITTVTWDFVIDLYCSCFDVTTSLEYLMYLCVRTPAPPVHLENVWKSMDDQNNKSKYVLPSVVPPTYTTARYLQQ